jgi:hypothetical protein
MCTSWLLLTLILSMLGSNMKLSNAQQAKIFNNYQNTNLKLLKTNAAIWFNRMCKTKHLLDSLHEPVNTLARIW